MSDCRTGKLTFLKIAKFILEKKAICLTSINQYKYFLTAFTEKQKAIAFTAFTENKKHWMEDIVKCLIAELEN